MTHRVLFITHPDVVIDASVPVPEWPLSDRGLARMRVCARQPWLHGVGALWSSTERKACDGAAILADALGLQPRTLAALGENDRSATGYLPRAEFEAVADAFFASPDESARGWETARAAQVRIVAAVETVLSESPADCDVAIVAHGGVGALLLCHLLGDRVSRRFDQPAGSGGNWFSFARDNRRVLTEWQAID